MLTAFAWALTAVEPAAWAQGAKAPDRPVPLASATDAKSIAADAYLQTYPLLQSARELDRQMNRQDAPDYVGWFNAFRHQGDLPSPKDATIRRKSYDAPYSWAWLDVRAEPVALQLPAIPAGRFVVAQVFDLWGHNVAHVDARVAGGKAISILVAGPGWKGAQPKGVDRVLRSGTSLVGVVIRTAAAAPGDGASVALLQRQYRIVALSQLAKGAAPKAAPPISFAAWDDAKADSSGFIGYVNALLPFVQPDPAEQVAFRRYAGIGMVAGKPWDPAKTDGAIVAAIDAGVADARGKLEKAMSEARGAVDPVGTREAYGGDAMKRAISAGFDHHRIARAQIVEIPITGDGGGDPFEKGAKYRLVFPPGQLPPVDGFWSLEMIGVPEVVYAENPVNRWVIDSRMPGLKKNADGSLEIAIQRESPGPELEPNWLPSPDKGFSLTLRLYAPKQAAVDGTWKSAWPNRMP
jgi:hypothetical protein